MSAPTPVEQKDSRHPWWRWIEFKIPLPWLLTGIIGVIWTLISMYFTLVTLVASVNELQASIKAFNQISISLTGDLALLRYRIDALEPEVRALRNQPSPAPAPPTRGKR